MQFISAIEKENFQEDRNNKQDLNSKTNSLRLLLKKISP